MRHYFPSARGTYVRRDSPPTEEPPFAHTALLALLADGPKRAVDLAANLGVARYAVVGVLNQLVFEGLVKRTGTLKKWCLASYRPDFSHRGKEAPVPHIEPTPDAPQVHTSPARPVVVIRGEAFEVAWDGRGPLPGSGEAAGLGTTLSGNGFKAYL